MEGFGWNKKSPWPCVEAAGGPVEAAVHDS